MRISTIAVFDQSVSSMHRQQSKFIEVGQQIASGKRVVRPSDDPQAASRAVGVSQSKAVTEQYTDARISARNSLSQEESILNSISDAITRAKSLLIQASSDTLGNVDRNSVASELKGIRETVLGQANATDGNGRHLFGGFNDSAEPFVKDAGGTVLYNGDGNVREERIDSSRLLPVGDTGEQIFQSVHNSAGYVAEADMANTGDLTFDGPRILDVNDPDFGTTFDLAFTENAGDMYYSVNGDPDQLYTAGETLTLGGVSITLEGEPADGDNLSFGPAQDLNTDLFMTFERAIAVLEQPAETDADKATRENTLRTAMRQMDNSLDNVLTVRASVGARLNELDTVDRVAEKRTMNYEQALSDLVDLDYVEAISDYSRRQIGLEAAQRSFVDISKLSLFNQM